MFLKFTNRANVILYKLFTSSILSLINTMLSAPVNIPFFQLILKFERCASRENPDSCEPYPDVNIKDICTLSHQDHKPWSSFAKNLDPPLYCPYKKGVYICRNATFDGTALSVLPISGFFWKVRALLLEPGANISMPVLCIHAEGEIVHV
ncbi:hypothetical protein RI129_004834 [Pyrocoelia pectoralis]|uniref:Uncharacterized protein n=1 Tax=Pyrocoelia pectoralis TaxID=417401 RepID=A0AAN7ZH34_9COLE